ncbi:uncharacterized protein V6R79_022203 [Siganus canaliculatus]
MSWCSYSIGCSLTKYMEKLEDIKKNYRYRKDEIFKRLKVTTFAQLILQVSSVSDLNVSDDGDSHAPADGVSLVSDADLERFTDNDSPQASFSSCHHEGGDTQEICHTARSTLLSVISGVGELSLDTNNQKLNKESLVDSKMADLPYADCPYLLLDVRDRDQYDQCHIISAQSFPISSLTRTMNPYTKEVLEYVSFAQTLRLKKKQNMGPFPTNISNYLQEFIYLCKGNLSAAQFKMLYCLKLAELNLQTVEKRCRKDHHRL